MISATLLVYLPSLNNNFVNWDDSVLVYNNPNIRSIDSNLLRSIFTPEVNPTGVPLTIFSYALDYALWGLDPFHFHLTNLIIHLLNSILVFILIYWLIEWGTHSSSFIPHPSSLISASVTALLFGIHPLNAEAVNWVTGRSDLLAAFFFLLSLLSYLRYSVQASRRSLYYAISLLSFLLSLMSKPTSLSLPLVLLIFDLYLFGRLADGKWFKKAIIQKIPFFLIGLLSVLMTLSFRRHHEVYAALGGYPLITRLSIAAHSFIFYLYKMVLPINLAPYYPYPKGADIFALVYPGSLLLLLSLTVFCIRSLKRNTIYSVVWFYYIISLSPMVVSLLGFYKIGGYSEADRYAYIPSIAPFFLAGVGVGRLFESKGDLRKGYIALMAIMSILLSARTVGQTAVWRDSVSLWSQEIRIFPEVSISYYNRGAAYRDLREYEKALRDLGRAVDINPGYTEAYNNLGDIHNVLGNYSLAVQECGRAIKLEPGAADAYSNRGVAYSGMGRRLEAIADFDQAIRLNPSDHKTHYNKGNALRKFGDYREAVKSYDRALELNPEDAKVYNNRGTVFSAMKEYQRAISDFSEVIRLDTSNSEAHNNRGTVYYELKNYKEAMEDFKDAIIKNPRYGSAYLNLGLLYLSLGNREEAGKNIKTAAGLGVKQAQEYLSTQ